MRRTRIAWILLCLFLFIATPSTNILSKGKSEIVEDKPTESSGWPPVWNAGDYWIYDVMVNTSIEDWFPISFQGYIKDLKFSVNDVAPTTYTLKFNGKVKGNLRAVIHIDPVPFDLRIFAWLRRTTIDGHVTLTKEGWGLKDMQIKLHGKMRIFLLPIPLFIPIPFDITTTLIFDSPWVLFGFSKLDIGEYWVIYTSPFYARLTLSLFRIFSKSFSFDVTSPEWLYIYTECVSKENVTVPAGTYEAYKIWVEEGGVVEYYYAPKVNNIVKLQTNEELYYFNFKCELKSTNYE